MICPEMSRQDENVTGRDSLSLLREARFKEKYEWLGS